MSAGPARAASGAAEEERSPPAQGRARRLLARLAAGHAAPLGALAVIHAIAFSKSLFGTRNGFYVVPWDFDGSYHRFLVYVSDCFRAGTLPLWNPFNAAGTPLFANPQSQIWSPVTLLLGATVGYTHALAQRQLVLTILLGGAGAYLLAARLWRSRWAGLFAGLCYDLTSAVFTNMQHMDIVNAAALLPWIAWATLRAADGARWALPALAFLLYWQVTWGYPAVVAMGMLWLVALWLLVTFGRFDGWRERLVFVGKGAVAAALALGLAAVHWLPILAHRGDFPRGAALLDVEHALKESLTFGNLWGLLLPMMSGATPEGGQVDGSMVGLYVGVVALPLAAAALVLDRDRRVRVVALAGAVSLLLALGSSSVLRWNVNWFLPVFNTSRFPAADSRTLAALALALLAGAGARLLEQGRDDARALALRVARWLVPAVAAALLVARLVLYPRMDAAGFLATGVNGASAAILFLLGALLVLARCRPAAALPGLALLLALDLSTNLLLNYRMVGQRRLRADYAERVRTEYRAAIDPQAALAPRQVSGGPPGTPAEVALQGMTRKRFDVNDYGNFRLSRYERLLETGFGPWLASGARVAALPPDAAPADFAAFERAVRPVPFRITAYRPTSVDYEVTADAASLLVFNEIFFPGWRARVDGAEAPVVEVADGLRGLRIAPGRHVVETWFRPRVFELGAAISLAALAAALGWLAWIAWPRRRAPEGASE